MKVQFIVGPHESGKESSVEDALKNEKLKDVEIIDVGLIMRDVHHQQDTQVNIDEIIASRIQRKIGDKEKVIIIGYRTIQEIDYFISIFNIEEYQVLYVDASIWLLSNNYENTTKRKVRFTQFKNYIEKELLSGLFEIKDACLNGKDNYQYIYRSSNDDSIESILLEFFGSNKKIFKKNKWKKN